MSLTTFGCGHPIAEPYLRVRKNGKPYCHACSLASRRRHGKRERDRIAADPQLRQSAHMAYRVRILPVQLEGARNKLAALENEARRYGMTELLERQA